MKSAALATLALSFAANAAGLLYLISSPEESLAENPPLSGNLGQRVARASTATESVQSDNPPAVVTASWKRLNSTGNLQTLVANLRAAGFPPAVVRAIVNEALNEKLAASNPQANRPFWRRTLQGKEDQEAFFAYSQERAALFESLLGDDARPSATLSPTAREHTYGKLTDRQIDGVAQIGKEYLELLTGEAITINTSAPSAEASARFQRYQLLEKEKVADIAAFLGPEAFAEYERRNSPSASTVAQRLRNIDVSEPEFTALFELQKAVDQKFSIGMGNEMWSARGFAQLEMHREARRVLTDDRYFAYLELSDGNYRNVAKFMGQYPELPRETSVRLYELQTEASLNFAEMPGNLKTPEERRVLREEYNRRLEALVGPSIAAEYRKGLGRGLVAAPAPNPIPRTGPGGN